MKVMFNCCPKPLAYTLFRGEDKKPETPAVTEQPKTDTVEIKQPTGTQSKTDKEPEKCEGPDCKK